MNRDDPLPHMSAAQVEDYAAWLQRLAGRRQGSLPDRLRQIASDLRNLWRFT
jgi:hypothetical protein